VHLETETLDGPWRSALPAQTKAEGHHWHFTLPETGVEPLLTALVKGKAGIRSLSIERPGLHDAFVAIAGEDVAAEMDDAAMGDAK
jgi:ABC-2 type transport system ATP-binding protein